MRAIALCVASGAAYAALFPPLGGSWLAWIALVPLLVACAGSTPLRAAGLGLVWALTATVGIAWWLPQTFERFFDVPPALAWLGFLAGGVLIDGLPYAALGAWLAWVSQRRAPPPWAVASGWAVAEYARVNAWLGNPFGLLAYSQHGAPFAQIADLAGPYGVGMLVLAVNAAIAGLVTPVLRTRRPAWSIAGTALIVAAAWLYGAARLGEPFDEGAAVSVAVVQPGVQREARENPAQRAERLERYLAMTRTAAEARPDIVFWPEYAIDFYLREPTRERTALLAAARALGADLVLGGPDYRGQGDTTQFYNSVFLLRGGRVAGHHDKTRLVPFAEYGPFGDALRAETALYVPGDAPRALDARAGRIGAFLCAEALYPDLVRTLVRDGAALLANPSNDYWLGVPAAAEQQVAIAAFRAIETRRFVVRATPTGTSAVIDPHGRVVESSRFGAPDLLVASVRPLRGETLYVRFGDAACAAALALVLGFSCWAAARPAPDRTWR
jgi:apolipoprotein N-acyltransferase